MKCDSCGVESRNGTPVCDRCGDSLASTKASVPDQRDVAPVCPAVGATEVTPARPERPTRPSMASSPRAPRVLDDDPYEFAPMRSGLSSETIFKVILIGFLTAFFIALGVWLFTPNSAHVRVTGLTWMRQRVIEERHVHNGEGWRNDAPAEVFAWDACETRQHGTRDCHPYNCRPYEEEYECGCTGGDEHDCDCHRVCSSNGNGSARCSTECRTCGSPRRCRTCSRTKYRTCYEQCPVYAEWCSYRYHQWDEIMRRRLTGDGHTASWPDIQPVGAEQRMSAEEEYTAHFVGTGDDRERTWNEHFPFARYETFNVGQRYGIEWTRAGGFTIMSRDP